MIRSHVIESLVQLSMSLGPIAYGTKWHLFGSVNRGDSNASDIDLMIFCESTSQADMLRRAVDPDSLFLPIDLSLFTFEEAAAIDVAKMQHSTLIIEVP